MIHILGAGSIGKLIAHTLRRQDIAITILTRPNSLNLYKSGWTLNVVSENQDESVTSGYYFESSDSAASTVAIKNLIVCTKSCQSAQAVAQLAGRLNADSQVVLLNNGIGVDNEIRRVFKGLPTQPALVQGIISHGVYAIDHGSICHAGMGQLTLSSQTHVEAAEHHARLLQPLQSNVVEYSLFQQLQLEKLIVNAVVNPVTAITEQRNGDVLRFGHLIDAIIIETIPVLEVSHPDCQFSALEMRRKVDNVIRSTAKNKSSMLQDMQAGRTTEIEYINGAICNLGKAHGLKTHINSALVRLVRNKTQLGENVIQDFKALLANVKRA